MSSRPSLRPYQSALVTGLADKLSQGKRKVIGQLVTGGGKSIVFAAICDRFLTRNPGSRILILVHREELLKQARKTLMRAFDLQSHPLKAGTRWIPDVPVYVGMVESAYRRLDRLPEIGLVIIDECHLNLFAKHHEAFGGSGPGGAGAYFIGFTATPLSAQKKKPLNALYEDIVCGPQPSELIAQGALVQNITIAPKEVVNRAELALKSSGEFDDAGMAKAFKKYVKNCVSAYEKHAAGTKTIVFNVNIEHSKEVCAAFVAAGYPAQHLDGTETPYRRAALLKWFHDTPDAILCNVAIATTGFDEPSIETVIVNRATTSMPLWLQMTGRGSRPHEGKQMFRILDMGGNAITLGDWCSPRDWSEIFRNPPKPGKGGVAPVKSCPRCDAIVPAGVKTCPYCGHAFEHPEDDLLEEDLRDFVVVTRGIDVPALMARNSERKKYYTFFQIGRRVAEQLHKRIGGRPLTEQDIRIAQRSYEQLAAQWCAANKRPFNDWHKKRAEECLAEELRRLWPAMSDRVSEAEREPEQKPKAEPERAGIKPLTGIQPLNLMSAI